MLQDGLSEALSIYSLIYKIVVQVSKYPFIRKAIKKPKIAPTKTSE